MQANNLFEYANTLVESSKDLLNDMKNGYSVSYREHDIVPAIIFCSWAALEGYINYIGSIAKYAKKLEQHERIVFDDKELVLGEKGFFEERKKYQSTAKKYLFLLERFSKVSCDSFRRTKLWGDIKNAEILRNALIHPKESLVKNEYSLKKAEDIHNTTLDAIKYLNKKTLKSSKVNGW